MASKCACGGNLGLGFIPDFGHMATWVAVWLPGEPKFDKTIWETVKTGGGVATKSEGARMVEAYCCESCGRLELYANKPVPKGASPSL